MDISSISSVSQIDLNGAQALAQQKGQLSARPDEVAKQFEGMFLSMILKQMRATLDEGMFGNENSDSYGALFDLHMGQHLAERGGLGIRDMIKAQYLQNQNL